MALDFRAEAVSHAFCTVSFFMAGDDRTIRVDVPKDLRLASVGSATPLSKYGYEDRLMRCRKIFNQIATRKYLAGDYKPEVRVLVVRITAKDLDPSEPGR